MGGFWKNPGKFFKKPQLLSVQFYLIPFISKPLVSKKLIKKFFKSD